jgi:transposase
VICSAALFRNAQFTALFSSTGQPAEDPARLALMLLFQFLEGLSDRQVADALRDRIAWKYALALELTDPGFDASILNGFDPRLCGDPHAHLTRHRRCGRCPRCRSCGGYGGNNANNLCA